MSDSSSEEDLSRFREAVDCNFSIIIDKSRANIDEKTKQREKLNQKSERYLEVASHYNDVKVPKEMQNKIGAKISAIIDKSVEYINLDDAVKKRKIKGGIKLFKHSDSFMSCEEAKDTYTHIHNAEAKKIKRKKRMIEDITDLSEADKINSVVLSGDYVLSKEETKCWKSRRKEKIFKYKSSGKSKVLTAVE
ncbi:hypothetical protein ACJJTC_006093 [Scirpophaga incertulas]